MFKSLRLYCYNDCGGYKHVVEIKSDVRSLARAIMYYGAQGNLMVTDIMDMPVVSTMGIYIDRWFGNGVNYGLMELHEVIIPMQKEFKIPKKLDFLYK